MLCFATKWTFQTGKKHQSNVFMCLFCLSCVENRRKISDIIVIYKDLLVSDVNPVVGSFLGRFCALFFSLDVEFWKGKETSSSEYLIF